MIGVFASLDLVLFFLFWEVMLIPMYFLIGIWGHERRVYAAIKFVLFTMVGSALMLAGIIYLYNVTGSFDLPRVLDHLVTISASSRQAEGWLPTERWLFLAFFIAFAIKVPLFPFHTWLPDAHVEAPTAGSVILAGVLLKMGTYGMLRFCLPLFPDASREFAPVICVLAIVGIIYGALVAMVQPDLKRLVAYSSVAHLGFCVLGIFVFRPEAIEGAIYQMFSHGVSTGALFMLVGMLYERRHTRLISEFGGLATSVPVYSTFFLIVALASVGLPLLNGFVGEFLIIVGSYYRHAAYAAFASAGVVLAAVYLLWVYQRVFYGEITNEKNRTLPDCDLREKLILTIVVVVIMAMGVYPQPFLRRMDRGVTSIMLRLDKHSVLMTDCATPSLPRAGLYPFLPLGAEGTNQNHRDTEGSNQNPIDAEGSNQNPIDAEGSNQNPSPLPGERVADEGGRVRGHLAIAAKTLPDSGSDPSPPLVPRAPSPQGRGPGVSTFTPSPSPQGRGLENRRVDLPGPRRPATSPLPTAHCLLPTASAGGGR
jgi:NADH-quinone oxidoreductase subunit M